MTEITQPPSPTASLAAYKRNNAALAGELHDAATRYWSTVGNTGTLPAIRINGSDIDTPSLREFIDVFSTHEQVLESHPKINVHAYHDVEKARKDIHAIRESAELLLKSEVVADSIANGDSMMEQVHKDVMNYATQNAHTKLKEVLGR